MGVDFRPDDIRSKMKKSAGELSVQPSGGRPNSQYPEQGRIAGHRLAERGLGQRVVVGPPSVSGTIASERNRWR
jgi:hypothetical protein